MSLMGETNPLPKEGVFLSPVLSASRSPKKETAESGPSPPTSSVTVHYRQDIACSPLLVPLLRWIISSLPPQRQFASHHLVVIIILDDKLWQLPLPRQKIPASRILPRHREGSFIPKGEKTPPNTHFKCSFFKNSA